MHHRKTKSHRISMIIFVLLTAFLACAYLVNLVGAQSEEYEFQTTNIFSDSIDAVGWSQVERLYSQDLSEDAMYGNFDVLNSAKISTADTEEPVIELISIPSQLPSIINDTSVGSEGSATSTAGSNTETDEGISNDSKESVPADVPQEETSAEEVTAPPALEQDDIPIEAEPVPEEVSPDPDPEPGTPEGTAVGGTGIKIVQFWQRFASAVIDIVDSVEGGVSGQAIPLEETDLAVEAASDTIPFEVEDTSEGEVLSVSDIQNTPQDVSTSGPVTNPDVSNEGGNRKFTTRELVFSDFGVGEGFERQEITNVQLRFSLAARRLRSNEEGDEKILIEYFYEGEWFGGGMVMIDDEVSNAINGGYFLYALPLLDAWVEIEDLQIRLSYTSDTEEIGSIYLDSLWLEVESIHEDFFKYVPPSAEELNRSSVRPFDFDLLSNRLDFKVDESPFFTFRYSRQKNLLQRVGSGILGLFGGDEYDDVNVRILNEDLIGRADVDYRGGGEFTISLKKAREFRPGKKVLRILIRDRSGEYVIEQEFVWGVLAMNVNKSIYLPNETAYIQMGVIDDFGHTICNAELELWLTDTNNDVIYLSTQNGKIEYGNECAGDSFTTSPDYFAFYELGEGVGTYKLELRATTQNGVHTANDTFEVMEGVSFDVERVGPTRIYPLEPYPFALTITANENYVGEIIEYVPRSFQVVPLTEGSIPFRTHEEGDIKQLIWDVAVEAGETIKLEYKFDAPNRSPEFYLLGPLQIGSFAEIREWQIASDAPVPVVESWSQNDTSNNQGSVVVTAPSGITDGDLLIGVMSHDSGSGTLSPPAGFTALHAQQGSSLTYRTWYKIASSESGNYTFTSSDTDQLNAAVVRISGVDQNNPINVVGINGGADANPTAPSVTTTIDDAKILRFFGSDDDDITVDGGYPSAHAGLFVQGSGGTFGETSIGAAHATQTTQGATGAASFTLTVSNEEWEATTVAVAPPQYVTIGSIGNQVSEIEIGTTTAYVGGAFIFIPNSGTSSVTSITITETGTVDAQNDLSNIRLYYEFDTSAPYDCASESYSGSETQYGATSTSFSSANGTSTFAGAVTTGTTSVLCVYTILDVDGTATNAETLDIEISDPMSDVVVSSGTLDPDIAVAISDTTSLVLVGVPTTPVLEETPAFPSMRASTTQPVFGGFVSTDNEGDPIEYEFSVDDDYNFGLPATTTTSSNFPTDAGWASSTFASGATTTYAIQSGDALTDGATYWWRVRARDPSGTNEWSEYSEKRSITIDSSLNTDEWYQTLGLQFVATTSTSTLNNTATTTGGVELEIAASTVTILDDWTTGSSKSISSGNNRLLMVAIYSEDSATDVNVNTVTYGGSLVTEIGDQQVGSGFANGLWFGYLDEAGIASSTGTGIVPTWVGSPPNQTILYASVVFENVDQNNPVPDSSGATTISGSPIQTSNPINVEAGDMFAYVTVAGEVGSVHTEATGYTEGTEEDAGGNAHVAANATKAITADGTEQPTAVWSVSNRLAIIGALVNAIGATGTIISSEIDHDWVPNQSVWGEVSFSATEPSDSSVRVRVYYTSATTCDTIVPDGALSGNSAGFATTSSPVDISGLSTSTYNRICLQAELDAGSTTTSPSLDDWTVGWALSPLFTQNYYRWYVNEDAEPPTDPWPIGGGTDLLENEVLVSTDSIGQADVARLRMSLLVSNSPASAGDNAFKLQYAEGDTCSEPLSWQDIGPISSSTALWRGSNNVSVSDGATLSSTTLSVSDVFATYEEENDSAVTPNTISVGEDAEWDWVVQNNTATPGTNYCFRMTKNSGVPLDGYTNYPQAYTNNDPDVILDKLFDNEQVASTTPWFEFISVDDEGESAHFQVQIDNDADFSSTIIDTNTEVNLTDFANLVTPSDKAPYNDGETIRYISNTTFANGNTYWWRIRAKDPDGANVYGDWTTARSFTIDTTTTFSAWFQTTDDQFETNTLFGVETGSNEVDLITGSSTGIMTSPFIDFDWVTSGNIWGELQFIDTETSGDLKYQIEYFTSTSSWALIPDSDLSGNSAGFDTSPVALQGLDKSTYNQIHIVGNFTDSGASPILHDWTVEWGSRVETPTQTKLFPNERISTTTPTFEFTTVDLQGDSLTYQIQWSTAFDFSASTTRTSDVDTGFFDIDAGTTTDPFASDNTIQFTVQSGDMLTDGTTYWWRVRAKDTTGDDLYSLWTDPLSFTVATTTVVSTWFQTTEEQFDTDVLSGTNALVTDEVTVATSAVEALISYAEGTVQTPRYRTWNGTSWSDEASALNVGAAIRWIVTAEAPTREEYILATLGTDGDVNVQIFSLGAWGNLQEITASVPNVNARGVSVAYESNSGDAIVVACNGEPDPIYYTWDGSTWTSGGTINVTSINNCEWIDMAGNPATTSDEIIVLTRDTGADYEAQVWDGSSWGDPTILGGMSEVTHGGLTVEYEESGDQGVIVVGNNTANSFAWSAWNGASWSGGTQGIGDDFEWGYLTRDEGSDNMALCYIDNDNDIGWAIWNGSSWTDGELDTGGNSKSDRPVSCQYETTAGRDGYIMLPYSDTTDASYRYWNTSTWVAEASISTITDSATVQARRTGDGTILSIFYDDVNDRYDFSSWNGTSWSTVQTLESDGAKASTPFLEPFMIAPRGPAVFGTVTVSPTIDFNDGIGPFWDQVSWIDTTPGSSDILYQVQYFTSTSTWALIPDSEIPLNSAGTSTGPIDLSGLDKNFYDEIRLVATLTCQDPDTCPSIQDWTVEWAEGITISGIAREYDQVSSTTAGTVAVAVNGTLQAGKTGAIQSDGTWNIANVTTFEGDAVTVFVTGATDANEAIAVSRYDGLGNMTGMELYKRHLTLGSDDATTTPIANVDIGLYDLTDSEDLFFNVDGSNDLDICATTGCDDAELIIRADYIYQPGANIDTHDIEINGTLLPDGNTVRVSGSWDNNATATMSTSMVIFTATSTSETVDETGAISPTFNNLTFGETSGTATWTLVTSLNIENDLTVNYGTLDRDSLLITVAGDLSTGASGLWIGIGTTTFDGTAGATWSDASSGANVGNVVIDGTSKTVTLDSNVLAESITIEADDILDASGSNYDITLYQNWNNNNVFTARNGEVFFVATTTNKVITTGNSAFYDLTFNGIGGSWSFTGADLTISNDLTIATGTVTMPTGTTTLAGSFSSAGGAFAHNNATLYLTSGGAETITASGTAFVNSFYSMTFNGSGSWTFNDIKATSSNDFIIQQGAVTIPSGILAIGGSFTNSGGSFVHNNGTLQFTSTAAETIDTNASFGSLLFSGSGAWSFVDSAVTAVGDVTVANGVVTFPATSLTIGGSLTNNASIAHNNGSVVFNSTDAGETIDLGNSSLYDMTFNGTTGGWTIIAHATATSNFSLTSASDFTLSSSQILTVQGTFSNTVGGASTTWTGSTLVLDSATSFAINGKSDNGDSYNVLDVGVNTDVSMWNSSSTSYVIDSSSSLYSQDHSWVDGDLYIFGSYGRTSGTEHWSYATDFDSTDLSGGSERQVDVRFASGATGSFTGSTLSIIGTSTASTSIASQSGAYTVSVSAGTTTASFYEFDDLGSSGLTLSASTTVTVLSDGSFIPVVASGSGLTVSSTTIDTNPALQIFRVNFATTSAISAFNVSQTDGAPSSFWWFRNGFGNLLGESFDNDTGDPGSIRWDDSSLTITASGTVYADAGATALGAPTCDGATTNVRVVVDGGATYDGACHASNGSYSISGIAITGDPVLTVFLNTGGGARAVTVTKTPTADIIDLDLYANRVMVRHEDVGSPLTITDMATYDEVDDSDIQFVAATGTPNTLTVRAENELLIFANYTFVPGGNITLQSGGSGNTYDGTFHIDNNATATAQGTESYNIGGRFVVDNGGIFTPASSTVTMTATTTNKTIVTPSPQVINFNDLLFTGVGGGWPIVGDISVAGDMTISTGTVSGTGDVTLTFGEMAGVGKVAMTFGTTTIERTNTLGSTTPWTFYDLSLGNGSFVGTTTRGAYATTTVLGRLTINAGHTLDVGTSNWDLRGGDTPLVINGVFNSGTGLLRYSASTSANVVSTTYYDLDLNAESNTPTYIATGLGINIANDLTVGGESNTTVNFDTNDPTLLVSGDITVRSNGTLIGSGSGSFTASGNWDNNGTFTHSGGTVIFDGAGTHTIAAGSSDFGSVIVNSSGNFTVTEHATATNAWSLTNAGSFAVSSGNTLAVGEVFTNGVGGSATTWLGSVLRLYGGGNYEINASTTDDRYDTLVVGSDTDIRMWNSNATTTAVNNSGSLYSQDHANVDGDLYIYSDYPKVSGMDYWSYATDFDGTSLSGSERKVDVFFAANTTATYAGGSLQMIGGASVSTTLQNQGGGIYDLVIGNNGTINAQYYEVRDISSSGLTITGAPTVTTLSNGDFEISQEGGTGITVGGTAINQNPAKTFTLNRFATSSGISSAFNVTATGTSVSSWRFTNHYGSIDGEAFDVDPEGDPGYIVWDDSVAQITISGVVYSDEGTTLSSICDGSTLNVHLRVAGVTSFTTTCNAASSAYSISGVAYSPGDELIVYIDGETEKAANVTVDPISSIANMDLYENRVIVRHENTNPITIADMAVWDSSDDADIPFTAIDGGTDTLTLPANRKLIVLDNKTFEPTGDVTLSGGGAGSDYDGSLELYSNAVFMANGTEDHSIGGHLIIGSGASIIDANSTFTFTTSDTDRTVDTNNGTLYNVVFNGTGNWNIADTNISIDNDFTITNGDVALPTGTTTVGGSFDNVGGSFDHSTGTVFFNSSAGENVRASSSDFYQITFDGFGSWTFLDTNATTSYAFVVRNGTVTMPSGTLTVGEVFNNTGGTLIHNSGILRLTATTSSTTLRTNNSDLNSVVFDGSGDFVMEDGSLTLIGSLDILQGSVILATNTLTIGGSLNAAGGTFAHASNTTLFNSGDTGETIDPGNSLFNNVSIANPTGGWTVLDHATTSGNFSLTSASDFTLNSGARLTVNGVFTNTVGGASTTWSGSILDIQSNSGYTINTKTAGGDIYDTLIIGPNIDIRMWNSNATSTTVDTTSSLYSQDHAGVNGDLYVYGDYGRTTGVDYWSYTTDFDGTDLSGGSERAVSVLHATSATTTIDGGTLQIIGISSATATIDNQGSDTYSVRILSGTLNASYYSMRNLGAQGLELLGTSTITSLSFGDFELAVSDGALITVSSTTVNANASKVMIGNRFATTSAITGTNVELLGVTANAWTFTGHYGNLDGEGFDVDGGDACGSIRWDDSSCLITQQAHYRWRNDNGGEGVPNSEWFDTDWSKRQRVIVMNNDATTYTNATVRLNVTHDSNMQADFDDLRFTDSGGTTTIPYWIEDFTASTDAIVWVKVPTLATSSDTNVFMYYGNGGVSDNSSGTTTFNIFDDFEDNDIAEYSGDTSLFQTNTSNVYERTYRLEATDVNGRTTDGIYNTASTVSQGETVRFFQYIDTSAGSGDETCTLFGVQAPGSDNNNYAVCLEQFGTDRVSISKDVTDNDTSGTVLASTTITYATGWHEVEIRWGTNDFIDVTISRGGSVVATASTTDSSYTSGGIGYTFWFQHGGWDIYTSRPLLATEPSVSFGVEQVSGGATWYANLDTPATGIAINTTQRLRFVIENTGLPITDQNFRLDYADKGASPSCEAVDSGDYVQVPSQAGCGTSPICTESSTFYSDGASTTDLLTGLGTFTYGQTVEDPSNSTGDIDVGSSEFTEVEYALEATNNATSTNYCFRVTDGGTAIDSYIRVAEMELKFDPSVLSWSLNNGLDITLSPGATTTITATGTVSDANGYIDLNYATATIYRSALGELCTADNNNCYQIASTLCIFSGCSGNTCNLSCSADIYYFADPTDIGVYSAQDWRADVLVSDTAGGMDTQSTIGVELITLQAITASSTIGYGSLEVNADTGSFNPTTTIQNIGNASVDITLEGTDLTDGGSSVIPPTVQKYATSTFIYSSCTECTLLSTSTSPSYEVDLDKPVSTSSIISDQIFWGITVPFGAAAVAHEGTNTFFSTSD